LVRWVLVCFQSLISDGDIMISIEVDAYFKALAAGIAPKKAVLGARPGLVGFCPWAACFRAMNGPWKMDENDLKVGYLAAPNV